MKILFVITTLLAIISFAAHIAATNSLQKALDHMRSKRKAYYQN